MPDPVSAPPEDGAPPARGPLWRRVLTDISPAQRYPAYRRVLIGQFVSNTGGLVTQVAVPVQVYALTHSSFKVGLLGLVAFVPLVLGGIIGGAVADAVDRRRLALTTSTILAMLSVVLVGQAVLRLNSVLLLYAVMAVQSAVWGVDSATRGAIIPRLVPLADLPAATALGYAGTTLSTTAGPLLAGLLIAGPGYGSAYGLDVLSFGAALYGLFRLPPLPSQHADTAVSPRRILDGFAHVRSHPVVAMTFYVDLIAMVFGMPRALFPALAAGHLGGGAQTVGFLYAALAFGGFLGTSLGGWFGRVSRQGLAVLVSVVVWGAMVIGFGLTRSVVVALVLLAGAGAADAVSAVFRNAILQTATPDELRGRLQGIFFVVVAGGPRLGDVESGSVASVAGLGFAVVSGGIAVVVGTLLLGALVPSFRRYRTPVRAGGGRAGPADP